MKIKTNSFINKLSKLQLIKEIAERTLNQNYNINNKNTISQESFKHLMNKKNGISFNEKGIRKENIKLKRNKSFDIKFGEKYMEISRNNSSLSKAIVIEKQQYLNSRNKKKVNKRPKIPLRLFSSGFKQMTALEKYYFKFGVFPICF
jgi:hypothetical protein